MNAMRCVDRIPVKTAVSPRSRLGFTLIELFVALGIILVLMALLLPARRTGREASRRTQCRNNLKQIGLALHNYESKYGAFPPAYTVDADGKPLHSWRTLILPFLDQAALYGTIDLSKPWDDPANLAANQTTVPAYACPSAPTQAYTQTVYLAVVTPSSAFCPNQPRKISEIKDGTDQTLLVIEAPSKQAVPWMSPLDANEATILGSFHRENEAHDHHHTGGEHALLADGTVRFLSQNLDPKTTLALISAASHDTVGEF